MMSNNRTRSTTRRLTRFSLFLALEIILGFTPLGMITVPPISITTLHVPVILCAITMGPLYGGLLGFGFGLISLFKATSAAASPVDMLFNPAASGNPLASLIMCLLPRILLGVVAALLYKLFAKLFKRNMWGIGLSAALSTILHTVMVLGCLFIFFSAIPFQTIFATVISLNGWLEILMAIFISVPVCNALLKYASSI